LTGLFRLNAKEINQFLTLQEQLRYSTEYKKARLDFPIAIRQLYAPVQPTVKQTSGNVSYVEFLPHLQLQPFIYCYWELQTTEPLTETFHYRVVADGCIDLFFEQDNPSENFVMGFCKTYTEFALSPSFHYTGVRFLPTMFPQLFHINASELSNRFEMLQAVVPDLANYIQTHFTAQQTQTEIKDLLDTYFLKQLNKASFNFDNRLYDALQLILKHDGVISIEKDLNTGISPRQLRRLFEFYIGDSAKTFSKVVRFQQILRAKPSTQSLRKNKLFFDAGYSDQAHFIKEFKYFYGVTPSKAFGR
jgi:AraC-like DNA-binding protein